MKKVPPPSQAPYVPINWNTPQWVVCTADETLIVLTTGTHYHTQGEFEGTALPCSEYPSGQYKTTWDKEFFKVLKREVRFVISNDD